MGAKTGFLALSLALLAGAAAAQSPAVPNANAMYCSGVVTNQPVPRDFYIISGEESMSKLAFAQGDLVYINRGASQGVKVGDEFLVSRPIAKDALEYQFFAWQNQLLRAMGTTYQDLGRIRVIHVDGKVSTAEIVFGCDYMQRGDLIQSVAERPAPPLKSDAKFDRYAPPAGKSAMIVTTYGFTQSAGARNIVYVNLGSAQGVKVGDYFRVFRYQGTHAESATQTEGYAYKIYGFGSTPVRYEWKDIPREIIGEGVVLRVSPNSSTVMITLSVREIYVGDYVEIE